MQWEWVEVVLWLFVCLLDAYEKSNTLIYNVSESRFLSPR